MNNKLKLHHTILFILPLLILCGFTFTLPVHAEDGDSGDSGGFMIESERVEGQMDILKALVGEVDIKEGEITGLTITKRLETGENQEPLIVIIKSPGPIPVKDLKAKTVGRSLPDIGGLCLSKHLGWLCLSDVTMTVTEQSAQNLTLPEATVKTCYESECGTPEHKKANQEEIQALLEGMKEQQSSLQNAKEEIEEDKEQLKTIRKLLDSADETVNQLKEEGQPEALGQMVKEITQLLDSVEESQEKDNEAEPAIDSEEQEQLMSLTKQAEKNYPLLTEKITDLIETLEKASGLLDELDKKVQQTAASLAKMEKKDNEKGNRNERKLAANYAKLIEKAEEDQSEINSDAETDDAVPKEKHADLQEVKKTLEAFKEEIQVEKDRLNDLASQKNTLAKQVQTVTDALVDIKEMMIDSEEAKPKKVYEKLIKHLKDIELPEMIKEESEKKQINTENHTGQDGAKESTNEKNSNKQTKKETDEGGNTSEQDADHAEEAASTNKSGLLQRITELPGRLLQKGF